MLVIKPLKLNKFSPASIASARALASQVKPMNPSDGEGHIDVDPTLPVNSVGSKLQTLALGEKIAQASARAKAGDNPEHESINVDPREL